MLVQKATYDEILWLVERVGFAPTAICKAIKAVDAQGEIRGMVAYDGWTENSVVCHMAVDSPIAWRSLVRPAFKYAFEQAGRKLILGIVAGDNARSLTLVRHFGFREAYRVKNGLKDGVDLVIHEMRREDCRFLERSQRKAA